MPQDYYEILGIDQDATQVEIKLAAQARLDDIKTASAMLDDDEKRRVYDESLVEIDSFPINSTEKVLRSSHFLLKSSVLVVFLTAIAGGYWFFGADYLTISSNSSLSRPPDTSMTTSVDSEKFSQKGAKPIQVETTSDQTVITPVTEMAQPTTETQTVLITSVAASLSGEISSEDKVVTKSVESNENVSKIVVTDSSDESAVEQVHIVESKPVVKQSTENIVNAVVDAVPPIETVETTAVIQELSAKILYKDFFVQNEAIALTIQLINNLKKDIQFFDGIVTLYDQNSVMFGKLLLSDYDILKNVTAKDKYKMQQNQIRRWGVKVNLNKNQAIYAQLLSKRLSQIQVRFFLTEVTYTDGEKIQF